MIISHHGLKNLLTNISGEEERCRSVYQYPLSKFLSLFKTLGELKRKEVQINWYFLFIKFTVGSVGEGLVEPEVSLWMPMHGQ